MFNNPFYIDSFQSSFGHRISGRILKTADGETLPIHDERHDDPNPAFGSEQTEFNHDDIAQVILCNRNRGFVLCEYQDVDLQDEQVNEYTETQVSSNWVMAELDRHLEPVPEPTEW